MQQIIGGCMQASRVALGCMRLASLDEKTAERVVMTAVEAGIDFFDHADIYGQGESERLFGSVLKKHPELRKNMLIQSKCGICSGYYDSSKEHIIEAAEKSLTRLGIDCLDALLIHRPDALMEPEEIASAFETLHAQGKVKHFGVSNMNPCQIALIQSALAQKLVINQLQFGLCHTPLVDEGINVDTFDSRAAVRTGGALDYCRLQGITVQAWSPLQHGMFEGPFLLSSQYAELNAAIAELSVEKNVSKEAIALAWILRHPAQIQVVLGSVNPERIQNACKAAEITLSRPEWYRLYQLAGNPLP